MKNDNENTNGPILYWVTLVIMFSAFTAVALS